MALTKRYGSTGFAWLLICVLALVAAGCSKQRSDLAMEKAKTNIDKARTWTATEFPESKSAFESAEASLKSAREAYDGRQFSPALQSAKDAVKQSQEALNQARTRFADTQLQRAKKSVEVATINDGSKENAELFERAQAKLNESQEKYQKQKYEDSINLSSDSINAVEQLLAHLKNTSVNKLAELDGKIRELEKEEANKFLPNSVIKAKEARDQVSKRIDPDRDYKQAIILGGTAVSDAQAGITETKKRKSSLELASLESKIAEAIAEEAPIYAPEALRTSRESFEEILKAFYENQYDTVLAAAELLKPKVDQLITMTRIEATKDKLKSVNDAITGLEDQQVEQYLPGRLKAMQDLHTQGMDLFNNNDYDGAKERANQALVEFDRIQAAFDGLAESTIQTAQQAFSVAKRAYDTMTKEFGTSVSSKAIDNRIDTARVVSGASLDAKLQAAAGNLKLSNDNRGLKQFRKAIELGKEVAAASEAVESNTYRLTSEHGLIRIQDAITGLMNQGAREYAPRQLTRVQDIVEQTQNLLDQKQNREAADSAAKARAYLENVRQELARRATDERQYGDEAIRRLQGGAAPTPPSGGRAVRGTIEERESYNPGSESPGGGHLNNKEAMFAEMAEMAAAGSVSEPIQLAQNTVGVPTNSTGGTGDAEYFGNRKLTDGTYMHSGSPGGVFTGTGQQTGTTIGTRPEPVVPTRDLPGSGSSEGSYETPTGPGPFVAVQPLDESSTTFRTETVVASNSGGMRAGQTYLGSLRDRVTEMLNDEQRIRDIRRFQPRAVERAREQLALSSEALGAQNYLQALTAAEQAQQILLEAEKLAAKSAAEENLQFAADRINVAQASGALTFAPAQLTEAINLFEQAEQFLRVGENIEAREASRQAIVAADDARLYNVNKARDLSALSTRYGGWKNSHPLLGSSMQKAFLAEQDLARPETALRGQEVAKQAVTEAQLALDHARDYTYQERIDNIYKALNTAMRAGANYFNVVELKRLIAELSMARDEYCTRNFDAVEMKLKDIEARLARVIETTPLVLEENLIECTNKLNALVQAGAENYNAQEVDDVKSLMNRAVIDFRKHDYYSSYTNIKNAMKLTDEIELRLQEQVYFDAVTELFAQLDKVFLDFSAILNYDRAFLKKLVTTPQGQPAAINFSGRLSPNDFRDRITDIYLRAIHTRPPPSQEGTHQEVLRAIKFAKVASENFQRLYIMDQLSKPDAYDVIDTAYNQINRAKALRSDLQIRLIDPQARTHVITAEKIVNF